MKNGSFDFIYLCYIIKAFHVQVDVFEKGGVLYFLTICYLSLLFQFEIIFYTYFSTMHLKEVDSMSIS